MGENVWVIFFSEYHEIVVAKTEEIAYEIMKNNISNMEESEDWKKEALEELASDYERVLATGAEDFGVMNVCHAELTSSFETSPF